MIHALTPTNNNNMTSTVLDAAAAATSASANTANATSSSSWYLFHPLEPHLSDILTVIVVSSDRLLETASSSRTVNFIIDHLNRLLTYAGVPTKSLITPEELTVFVFATILTLTGYYYLLGRSHVRRRRALAEDLRLAQLQVTYLEEKLLLAETEDLRREANRNKSRSPEDTDAPVRIFMDGAFDVMHYGHMNAFRLGRSLGTHLIVGVNSDETIRKCKGPPLMNDAERLTMVSACKFVDEVVPGCPYVMNAEYLDYVMKKYDVDYVIHGDDPCIVDGRDVYATAKAAGRYQSIPRTEGVSTTDIVGRMLLMTTEHHHRGDGEEGGNGGRSGGGKIHHAKDDTEEGGGGSSASSVSLLGQRSKFLTTSRMLRLFSAGVKNPTEDMRVIYMDGAWDMFHPGHVAVLKEAKQRGDYLIVGVHGDAVVNRHRGFNLPIMNLHERVLSVLGCRYVDDVLIDAPYIVTPEMIASLNIAEVVHGSRGDNVGNNQGSDRVERYRVPREAGIYKVIESPCDFSLGNIVKRIQNNQETFQAKFDRKKKQENEYYQEKYGSASVGVHS